MKGAGPASAHAAPDLRRPTHLLAFGFGAGLVPRAPGTAGTMVGVAAYLLLAALPAAWYLAAVAACFALGVWVCGSTGRDLGVEDHPGIVWDEIVGLLVALAASAPTWQSVAAGFVLFRVFDILKPWPVSHLERRIPGGLGVMLDDAMAGVYALAGLWILETVVGFR